MGLDVSKFVQGSVNRNISSVTSNMGRGLMSSGMSGSGVVDVLTQKLDSLISGGGSEYYAMGGRAVERINPQDLALLRNASGLTTGTDPESTIASSKDSSGVSMVYPPDIGEYYISFQFAKYQRPNPLTPTKFETVSTVTLPIPKTLVESFSIAYTQKSLGMTGGIIDLAQANYNNLTGKSDTSGRDFGDRAVNAGLGFAYNQLANVSTNTLGEAFTDAAEQFIGAIPNPHIAQIFQGPTFRNHVFNWRLAPNNKEESLLIKKIVNEFRKKSLPAKALSQVANVLEYPYMLKPTLYPLQDDDGTHLYEFKRCVVTNFNVNYAPTGVPSFFAGTKLPTLIDLSVSLQEIEYFLADDFGGDSGANGDVLGNAKSIFNNVTDTVSKSATDFLKHPLDSATGVFNKVGQSVANFGDKVLGIGGK